MEEEYEMSRSGLVLLKRKNSKRVQNAMETHEGLEFFRKLAKEVNWKEMMEIMNKKWNT